MNSQNRKRLTDLENKLIDAGGESWGEGIVRDGHVHTAIFKMNSQQGPTV